MNTIDIADLKAFLTAQVTQKIIRLQQYSGINFLTAQVTQKMRNNNILGFDNFLTAQVTQKTTE